MYDAPHQMEPLLPQQGMSALRDQAQQIATASLRLGASSHELTRTRIRELVRSMNSYYSNRIEGQGTHPVNIERALRADFSNKPDIARLQRIALAHIETEKELEALVDKGANALTAEFAILAHNKLYGRLESDDRVTKDGLSIVPGELRDKDVDVGVHVAPVASSLRRFLARFDEVYSERRSWDQLLIAVACAHHRMTWIHPFIDGNGRAARLQSHCALWELSSGLWSPSRGLARQRDEYYVRLANADGMRRGDLDGRGNLTEAGLLDWCRFFLSVCADQVTFMTEMLDLNGMKQRIESLVAFRSGQDKRIRSEAILPLYHVFLAGSLTRGDFAQMTGLGDRTARALLAHLLSTGLLESDGGYGPVRFGMPLDALQFLLPGLYPEAAAPATSLDGAVR